MTCTPLDRLVLYTLRELFVLDENVLEFSTDEDDDLTYSVRQLALGLMQYERKLNALPSDTVPFFTHFHCRLGDAILRAAAKEGLVSDDLGVFVLPSGRQVRLSDGLPCVCVCDAGRKVAPGGHHFHLTFLASQRPLPTSETEHRCLS